MLGFRYLLTTQSDIVPNIGIPSSLQAVIP
jgi:hypothetical protein